MKRGEIYWASLLPRSGSEQSGRRPVLVLSRNSFNQELRWQSVIVVPLSTSSAQAKRGPTAVLLPAGSGGLAKVSAALCHQITTLDRSKLDKCIGLLPIELLKEVEKGLKIAVDID